MTLTEFFPADSLVTDEAECAFYARDVHNTGAELAGRAGHLAAGRGFAPQLLWLRCSASPRAMKPHMLPVPLNRRRPRKPLMRQMRPMRRRQSSRAASR